jgi:HAD superfamily hydrolase (TIGR01509 family)
MTSPLIIPPGDYSAFIFDLDGTIADSMGLHFIAWQRALSKYKCEFTEPLFYAWAGVPTDKIVERLNEKYGLKMPPDEVAHDKEEIYFELLPHVQPIPEVMECIEKMHGKVKMAVVSGSVRSSVEKTLNSLRLFLPKETLFEVMLGSDEYPKGKPAPDGFLLAAKNLGCSPADCLVFEDADLGIEAAKAAGMKWVRIQSPRLKYSI